jgi:hypothetical protein
MAPALPPDPPPENSPSAEPDENLQQEILAGRTFSMAEAIARSGGDFLKGESTLPRLVQAQRRVQGFISQHLQDVSGALHQVLHRWVEADTLRLSRHIDAPLEALLGMLDHILAEPTVLYDLVWQVDMCWGQLSGERPHFQQPGEPPHPDDEYTHESVRQGLEALRAIAHATLYPPSAPVAAPETSRAIGHPVLRWFRRFAPWSRQH